MTKKTRPRKSRATGQPPGRPAVDGAVRERRVVIHMTDEELRRIDGAVVMLPSGIRADFIRTAIRHYMRHVLPQRLGAEGMRQLNAKTLEEALGHGQTQDPR